MPPFDGVTGETLNSAWKTLQVWGDVAPVLNLILLVLVLGGLISLRAKLRK